MDEGVPTDMLKVTHLRDPSASLYSLEEGKEKLLQITIKLSYELSIVTLYPGKQWPYIMDNSPAMSGKWSVGFEDIVQKERFTDCLEGPGVQFVGSTILQQ